MKSPVWAVPPGLGSPRPAQRCQALPAWQGDELDQAVVEAVEAVADQAAQVLVAGEQQGWPA